MNEVDEIFNSTKMCCMCLNTKNVFSLAKNHRQYKSFVNMFYEFTSIKIDEDVIIVCLRCIKKLNETFQFRKKCVRSYKFLNDSNDDYEANIPINLIQVEELHQTSHQTEKFKEQIFHCQVCSQNFESVELYNKHLKGCPSISDDEDDTVDFDDNVMEDQDMETEYGCSHCEMSYTSLNDLKNHLESHTNDKPFRCKECLKRFSTQDQLRMHEKRHIEAEYICAICNKKFLTSTSLNRHMNIHTGKKPYECSLCTSRFYTSGDLHIHMRCHTGEKPYQCKECGNSFRRSNHLNVHMRTHTGEKPYSCETCGKSFSQSGDLTAHKRIHSGERPYSCHLCKKKFVQGTALNKHLKSHSKSLTCGCCLRLFKNPKTLIKHFSECNQDVKVELE